MIDTTNRFARAAATSDAGSFIYRGEKADIREPSHWVGVAAEKPEKFDPTWWPDPADLHPDWSINVSTVGHTLSAGDTAPSDVFYRKTSNGIRVVSVNWATVTPAAGN